MLSIVQLHERNSLSLHAEVVKAGLGMAAASNGLARTSQAKLVVTSVLQIFEIKNNVVKTLSGLEKMLHKVKGLTKPAQRGMSNQGSNYKAEERLAAAARC